MSRFMLLNIDEPKIDQEIPEAKTLADKWTLNSVNRYIKTVDESLNDFQFSMAGEALRSFTWDQLADWYLEIAKIEGEKSEILNYILNTILKLWHPFMPFVTEAIWQEVYGEKNMLMVEKWPEHKKENIVCDDDLYLSGYTLMKEVVTGIRSLKADYKIDPVTKLNVVISAGDKKDMFEENTEVIKKLARLEELEIHESIDKPAQAVSFVEGGVEVFINLEGVVDFDKEKGRLKKEIDELSKYVSVQDKKLGNVGFVDNAPEEVVVQEKEKLAVAREKLSKLQGQLETLQ